MHDNTFVWKGKRKSGGFNNYRISVFTTQAKIQQNEGHFTHSKRVRDLYKRIFAHFGWIFLESRRIFATGVRDFLGVKCPSKQSRWMGSFVWIHKKSARGALHMLFRMREMPLESANPHTFVTVRKINGLKCGVSLCKTCCSRAKIFLRSFVCVTAPSLDENWVVQNILESLHTWA